MIAHPYDSAFEPYNIDTTFARSKPTEDYGFFPSFNTDETSLTRHPGLDQFESELDLDLADCEGLELFAVDYQSLDAFSSFQQGPASTFSVSTEGSTHDSCSSYSQSDSAYYNYTSSAPSYNFDLDLQFPAMNVDGSYDRGLIESPNSSRAFSDYQPGVKRRHGSSGSDYRAYAPYQVPASKSPTTPPQSLPRSSSISINNLVADDTEKEDEGAEMEDGKRRYKCKHCPRVFARAYNLKTHSLTHDPNSPRPHVCPHRTCGRSFSRKHDLHRHLTSIHRDMDSATSNTFQAWCESCSRNTFDCGCASVK